MYVLKAVEKLKIEVKKAIINKCWDDALTCINAISDILYNYNQYYYDKNLENDLKVVATEYLGESNINDTNEDVVLFYDGFGFDIRGLAQIYLLALSKHKKIIYITYDKQKDCIPTLRDLVDGSGGKCYYLTEKIPTKNIDFVKSIIDKHKPQNIFMYTSPSDVIITSILYHYKNKITSYQINLTDHAFWLGSHCFHYCLEFRDYGAYISNKYRNIPQEKLIMLPFYPIININTKFQGFPCSVDVYNKKVIFSGGSLYKTFGGEGKYYLIVDYILSKYSEVIFWYAGCGDSRELDILVKKYPNRVYFTDERSDLYQVLKNCYFYLSTYPLAGGLMLQYAAVAGKLPLTLRFDSCIDGMLINQNELGIVFDSIEEIKLKIDKIMKDENYLHNLEESIKKSVITPETFEENLIKLIETHKTDFKINFLPVDTTKFLHEYMVNMDYNKFCNIVANHRQFLIFKILPKYFISGIFFKIKNRLIKYL